VKAFGSNNVVYRDVEGVEGQPIKASVVYPNDPKSRLEVIWSDEKARRGPTVLVKDQSAWATANGIRIGSDLAEVQQLNGKPFKLTGFDWDYGGHVIDLAGRHAGTAASGVAAFSRSICSPGGRARRQLDQGQRRQRVSLDNPDMRAVEPYVGMVLISSSAAVSADITETVTR
jgi:hypothetical protein